MKRTLKKTADRRADIIDIARSLFQRQEYDKTTMQDVMDALDIAKGTIYHYFTSKEALLEAVIENIVSTNIDQMRALMEQPNKTVLQKIELLATAGNMSANNESVLNALHQPGNSAMHSRILASALTKQAALYAELIEQGCTQGIFKVDNPLECAEFMLAGIQFLTDTGIYPWQKHDIARRMQAFPTILEHLLQAPAGAFDFMRRSTKKTNPHTVKG